MNRRRELRYDVDLTVKVWGLDRMGKPFVQHARVADANPLGGLRLTGIDCVRVGEIIAIQHQGEKSRFQVVWVGRNNTPKARQIGVHNIDPSKQLFGNLKNNSNANRPYLVSQQRPEWNASSAPVAQRRPMPEIPQSRRKNTRYHCNGGVELRRQEGAQPVFGNLSDISLEGCYVETVATFPAGSDVVFLLRVGNIQVRGRAHVKTSNHAVGVGLEFMHLSAEDQQRLEFLVGTLAGTQEMRPEEKRRVVPEDPVRMPSPLSTRPANTASANVLRPPVAGGGLRGPLPSMNSAAAQNVHSALNELDNLEQSLVKDRVDPRLIAQLHDAINHVRQTASTMQQWMDLNSSGGDPFEVLPQLEAERMQMLGKLAHNVTADIDSTSINQYTLGVSQLYESVQTLYRRLHRLLVDESAG
jgi:PilZ domain-containing protein